MESVDPQQYLQAAELIHSKENVQQAIANIALQLNCDYANTCPIVLCVMGGATVFTGLLLPQLTFLLEFDYVQATRYHGAIEGKNVEWIVKPKKLVNNRSVLILDDILDEGITLKAIVDACEQLGAKDVKIAVLAHKKLNKSKPIEANYVGLEVPNRYVFGCGMDIDGWWRNLPDIYALRETNH